MANETDRHDFPKCVRDLFDVAIRERVMDATEMLVYGMKYANIPVKSAILLIVSDITTCAFNGRHTGKGHKSICHAADIVHREIA